MDFVADALFDGRKLRMLTVVDLFTRECLAIELEQSLKGKMSRKCALVVGDALGEVNTNITRPGGVTFPC
ncbi:hypothetical protein PSQ20_21555 [Curvibacter sp. RS43]|nr:hypothetical protein [Curvibacter sp. RS43]MDD0812938.1 hypothetical protein [Curvibacter sp. RS43]